MVTQLYNMKHFLLVDLFLSVRSFMLVNLTHFSVICHERLFELHMLQTYTVVKIDSLTEHRCKWLSIWLKPLQSSLIISISIVRLSHNGYYLGCSINPCNLNFNQSLIVFSIHNKLAEEIFLFH